MSLVRLFRASLLARPSLVDRPARSGARARRAGVAAVAPGACALGLLALAATACGGRVESPGDSPGGSTSGGGSGSTDAGGATSTADDAGSVTNPACAGSPGRYPLTGDEGHLEQLLGDACALYWVSGVGATGQGSLLKTVSKAGGPVRVLAELPSWQPLLAQDDAAIYVAADWSVPVTGSPPKHEVGVLRVVKAGGAPETLFREEASSSSIVGLAVAGGALYYDDDASLHRIDLASGARSVVPTRGPGAIVASAQIVALAHGDGVTRYDPALGLATELFDPGKGPWVHGMAVAGDRIYLAADQTLYEVNGVDVAAIGEPGGYFSVAVNGDTVFFARNAALEVGTYRAGVTRVVAQTGYLGNPTGLAIDPSGVYWSGASFIERGELTP